MKIYLASFNRASNGALSKLVQRLKEENMWTYSSMDADYILAVGDRTETFDFVLQEFRKGKPIIHLWAGETTQGAKEWSIEDEVYRHSMSFMSVMQLCTNHDARLIVMNLFASVGKTPNVHTVGNVMYDNLEVDESLVPTINFDLILYNPPTLLSPEEIKEEIKDILSLSSHNRIWIEPNGDKNSDLLSEYVTHKTIARPNFLGLMKHCKKFITNSSCAYYEAPFVMDIKNVVHIGERNMIRNSKTDMNIPDATENIIKILRGIKK